MAKGGGGDSHQRAMQRAANLASGQSPIAIPTQPPQPIQPSPVIAVRKMHPVVKYLRGAGIGAFTLGYGALLLADQFWASVILIYSGFIIAAVDIWIEPDLIDRLRWKITLSSGVILLAGLFSRGIVFVKAPLQVGAMVTDGEYSAGTVANGITWRPEFTELTVTIKNPPAVQTEDLNV